MLNDVTRSGVIQVWLGAVLLVAVAGIAFDPEVKRATWALLLAQSLVPPAVVLRLWPRLWPVKVTENERDPT